MTQATDPGVNDTGNLPANGAEAPTPPAANPPNNPSFQTLPDNHPIVVALNAQKERNNGLLGEIEKMRTQLTLVQGTLGQIDPTRLNEIQDAIKAKAEAEQREAAIRQAAVKETEERFTGNVNQLTDSLQSTQATLTQIQQSNALQGLFAQCGGQDYNSFKALIESKYRIEYGDAPNPFTPPPIRAIYNNQDGSPVVDEQGRQLKPDEVLSLLRQGKLGGGFGKIVKETFLPYNQSSGNPFTPSQGSPGVPEDNPFKHPMNMTKVGQIFKNNPALAKKMLQESGNEKAIAIYGKAL